MVPRKICNLAAFLVIGVTFNLPSALVCGFGYGHRQGLIKNGVCGSIITDICCHGSNGMLMSMKLDNNGERSNRRIFLSEVTKTLLTTSAIMTTIKPAQATLMSNEMDNAKIFQAGKAMGTEFAIERFKMARQDLSILNRDFDTISQGGGDAVRRYLGTVGVDSGMYGISKVLKELRGEAEDIVEYTEVMDEFDAYVRLADTACYSSNFVEHSSAKTKPEQFLNDARLDSKKALVLLEKLAVQLSL